MVTACMVGMSLFLVCTVLVVTKELRRAVKRVSTNLARSSLLLFGIHLTVFPTRTTDTTTDTAPSHTKLDGTTATHATTHSTCRPRTILLLSWNFRPSRTKLVAERARRKSLKW